MNILILLLLILVLFTSGCSQSSVTRNSAESHSERNIVAFVNVNIVPMDRERILKDQIVIVHNGIIEKIGNSSEINVPETAFIVEGQGKYLMPGLADMHVHINSEKDLFLFVSHGVTTVRNMWGYQGLPRLMGFPDQLKLRDRISSRSLIGPTIYTAGPILEGKPRAQPFMFEIKSVKEAEKAVAKQKEQGYDFIKVYDHLTIETYDAIISTGKKHGIPVIGHIPISVGIDRVLESGQVSIEHLTGYIDPDAAEFVIPEDKIEYYAQKTQAANVWNCPTIIVWQKLVPVDRLEEMARHPGMRYMSWISKLFLRKSLQEMNKKITYDGDDYNNRMAVIYYRMTKALHDAGAKLLLGTDAGNPFVFPGYSIHEELQYLVNAGLTPYEAIKTGTVNAAECLGEHDEFGAVTVGKRADLILVENNPLEDVGNIKKQTGVMVSGRWLPKEEIDAMLEKLK